MFSIFNDFISFYIFLPELFIALCLLVLFFFLIYDGKYAYFINKDYNIFYKKKLSLNSSIIVLIFIILIYSLFLYANNYVGDFEGDSFLVNPLINFTKIIYVVITIVAFMLFSLYNRNVKNLSFEFFIVFLFVFFSSILLIQANNLISFYIVIEIQSIVLYFLIAFDRSSSISAEAGLKYFLISIFMSILFLFGVALIYITFGTTSLSYLSLLLYRLADIGIGIYGILLIFIFILFKLAIFPFHFWALEVYEGASWPVISVLAVVSKVPLVFFLIRLFLTFGLDINFNFALNVVVIVMNIFGVCSILIGTFGAVYYVSLRKILVYSGIANIGYMLLSLGSSNFLALIFVYIYFIFYSLVLVLLLYLLGLIFGFNYKDYTFQFTGLSVKHVYLSVLFLLVFFILIGLPPLAGFWTKFLLLYSIMSTGGVLKALFIFLSNILSAVYYLRAIREIYFGKASKENFIIRNIDNNLFGLFIVVFLVFSLCLIFLNFDFVVWFILSLFI